MRSPPGPAICLCEPFQCNPSSAERVLSNPPTPFVHQKVVVPVPLTSAGALGSSVPKFNVEVPLRNLHGPLTCAVTVKVLVSAHAVPPAVSTASTMKNIMHFLMFSPIPFPG